MTTNIETNEVSLQVGESVTYTSTGSGVITTYHRLSDRKNMTDGAYFCLVVCVILVIVILIRKREIK